MKKAFNRKGRPVNTLHVAQDEHDKMVEHDDIEEVIGEKEKIWKDFEKMGPSFVADEDYWNSPVHFLRKIKLFVDSHMVIMFSC